MIHNVEQFIMQVEDGKLYEKITKVENFHGMEAFNVRTNGNDSFYALHLFAYKNTLYYSDASLTKNDIQRDENNYKPLVDDFHIYEYDDFPFEEDDFIRWIDERVSKGVEQGRQAYNDWLEDKKENEEEDDDDDDDDDDQEEVIVEDIPEWSLNYINYGEDDDLQEEDIRLIKRWMDDNDVQSVNPDFNKRDEYNPNPAFGKPCTTVQCVIIKKG